MKQLLEIHFGYGFKPTPAQLELLTGFAGKPVKLDKDGGLDWSSREYALTLEEALSVAAEFEVKKALPYARWDTNWADGLKDATGPAPVNEKCHVVVAGTSLLHIDTLQLERDCCTDILNDRLAKGWRILAICVQPDQRRPDYILGRAGAA